MKKVFSKLTSDKEKNGVRKLIMQALMESLGVDFDENECSEFVDHLMVEMKNKVLAMQGHVKFSPHVC